MHVYGKEEVHTVHSEGEEGKRTFTHIIIMDVQKEGGEGGGCIRRREAA